jgi:hypothetical protein
LINFLIGNGLFVLIQYFSKKNYSDALNTSLSPNFL